MQIASFMYWRNSTHQSMIHCLLQVYIFNLTRLDFVIIIKTWRQYIYFIFLILFFYTEIYYVKIWNENLQNKLQSRTKPLETIHKTRIFNLNVCKQWVKTFSHTPPPPYNVALGWNVLFNIEWGRRGLGILHEPSSNPVFNNCLNTFVQDCPRSCIL